MQSTTSSSRASGITSSNFTFGQQVDVVFLAAVNLFVALLPAVAANFADGHAVDADILERFFDFFHLERLNDCFDLFHNASYVLHVA